MKLLPICLSIFGSLLVNTISPVYAEAYEGQAKLESNWNLTRTSFTNNSEGVVLKQTEMGIPDNQAIAVLETPFDDLDNFSITLKMKMDEFVPSGKTANDVWTGVGIMGVPKFINWRNTEEAGLAKDTPGLFTRFFNYGGDLGLTTDVYQEGYKASDTLTVDTWTVLKDADARAAVNTYINIQFVKSYHKESDSNHYDLIVNDTNLTENGDIYAIDPKVMFPNDKIYLVLAMNTEENDFNDLSSITIKDINGVSLGQSGGNKSSGGCGGSIAVASSLVFVISICGVTLISLKKKREK